MINKILHSIVNMIVFISPCSSQSYEMNTPFFFNNTPENTRVCTGSRSDTDFVWPDRRGRMWHMRCDDNNNIQNTVTQMPQPEAFASWFVPTDVYPEVA